MSEAAAGQVMTRVLATTDGLADAFSDDTLVAVMLRFEVALAQTEARLGIIPPAAADAITRAAAEPFEPREIARAARASGTLAVPMVDALKAAVSRISPDAVPFVHLGATSQDVTDTALMLCLVRARLLLAADHAALLTALRTLSDDHARTVMLARTLLQPAAPTTFGLKAAGWYRAVARSGDRLFEACDAACVLQFGGAAGTLASLDERGPAVADGLGTALSLPVPPAPWHTQRDGLAALVAAAGIYVGALGKIARDISLLMQFELGEAAEPGGGSSAMPHKRNPAACAIVLAAATRMPGLVATAVAAMPQEHERGVGNWHAEAPTIADAIQTTGAALAAIRHAVDGLQVDRGRMQAHLEATRGVIFAERAIARLAPRLGAAAARQEVEAALEAVRQGATSFAEALAASETVRRTLTSEEIRELENADTYLGSAEHFRRRLLDPGHA